MASIFDIFNTKPQPPEQMGNAVPVGADNSQDAATTIITDESYGSGQLDNTLLSFLENFRNEKELIAKYVEMSMDPYINDALTDIVDEIVVYDRDRSIVELDLRKLDNKELPKNIKKKILEEFDYLVNLINFNQDGWDLVRDWYIKGKQFHYPVVDAKRTTISRVVQLAQENVKQVNHVTYKEQIVDGKIIKTIDKEDRYYIYNLTEKSNTHSFLSGHWVESDEAFKFKAENIIQVDSGIYDKENGLILSHLHSVVKTYNQLTQSEDAMVIYRMVRAPEKRAFYIDIGNLGKTASEKYINQFIAKFKTAQNYNAKTGKLHVGSKGIQSIYEDFWIPRKGNQTSEIDTLDSAQNLGELTDVEYLMKKQYAAMKIPKTRTDSEAKYALGRSTEIERDEFKFHRFIQRLRNRYSELFFGLLRIQLELKGIMRRDDFDKIRNQMFIEWNSDNFYEEIKDQEILMARLETVEKIEGLDNEYFTDEYINKNILRRTDEEYKEFINNKEKLEKESNIEIDDQHEEPA